MIGAYAANPRPTNLKNHQPSSGEETFQSLPFIYEFNATLSLVLSEICQIFLCAKLSLFF